MNNRLLENLHRHFGGNSLKNPEGKHVLMFGPTSKCPALHLYSITVPISKFLATIEELAGLSGFPHVAGSKNIINNYNFTRFQNKSIY